MGRTYTNKRDYDDDDERRKERRGKHAKHSRNIPGKGMKIINRVSIEDDDSDVDVYDSYYDNTTQTQRK